MHIGLVGGYSKEPIQGGRMEHHQEQVQSHSQTSPHQKNGDEIREN
jgi:hypothetical protein